MSGDTIEITATIVDFGTDAIQFNEDPDSGEHEDFWIPRTQLKNLEELNQYLELDAEVTIEIPEWLAMDRGLI